MAKKGISPEEDLFNQAIGRHIESLRKRAGLTQRALATAVGVKQQTLGSIECGKTRCAPYLMAKIARRIGLPVAALMRNTNLGTTAKEPG